MRNRSDLDGYYAFEWAIARGDGWYPLVRLTPTSEAACILKRSIASRAWGTLIWLLLFIFVSLLLRSSEIVTISEETVFLSATVFLPTAHFSCVEHCGRIGKLFRKQYLQNSFLNFTITYQSMTQKGQGAASRFRYPSIPRTAASTRGSSVYWFQTTLHTCPAGQTMPRKQIDWQGSHKVWSCAPRPLNALRCHSRR